MLLEVNDDKKLAIIWLTNDDQQDEQVSKNVDILYNEYKQKQYFVVIFRSGKENLYENTRDLILSNRTRLAKKAAGLA